MKMIPGYTTEHEARAEASRRAVDDHVMMVSYQHYSGVWFVAQYWRFVNELDTDHMTCSDHVKIHNPVDFYIANVS